MFKVFLNGLSTGMLLQFALGPVFFLILNITIQRSFNDGIIAVIGVLAADYIYIALAILGVGKMLENKNTKSLLGIIGSLILFAFGVFIILSAKNTTSLQITNVSAAPEYFSSFLSAFILTISSPLTIVFWTGLFAAKSIEKNYLRKELIIFGFSAGLTTLLFLGISVIIFSIFRTSIPLDFVSLLNIIVGSVLIIYAVMRVLTVVKSKTQKT